MDQVLMLLWIDCYLNLMYAETVNHHFLLLDGCSLQLFHSLPYPRCSVSVCLSCLHSLIDLVRLLRPSQVDHGTTETPCLYFLALGFQVLLGHFFTWVLGIQIQVPIFSCLHGKHFTNRATSQGPSFTRLIRSGHRTDCELGGSHEHTVSREKERTAH